MRAPSLDANRAPPANAALGLTSVAVVLAGLTALTGCPSNPPVSPRQRPAVRVRSFTEATPVQHILAVPPFAFAATGAGLDRWDLRSGQVVHVGAEHGMPGERVQALDYDQNGELWIATDAGLVRYDVEAAAFREVLPPPGILAVDSFDGATVSAVPGGAWVGLPAGLFHVTREGDWVPTAITAPVTDLMVEADGHLLWIGTSVGLFVSSNGTTTAFGRDRGCDLAAVRFVARGPDGRIVVVGENEANEQRIALASPGGCDSYRVSPDETWLTAASRTGELLVLTDRRLYAMRPPRGSVGRALVRDGMQLLPVPRTDRGRPEPSPFAMEAMSGELPAGAQALAAFGDEVLVGTRSLGTARVVTGRRALQWLRRGELMGEATSLSVACAARDDCYVATGSRRAWRFDGERFSPSGGGERRVLAVARDPDGRLVGLRQTTDGRRIGVAEIRGGEWRETGITVETPGRDPQIRFARFSPGGMLWLGLEHRDDAGELRPFGVAMVDLALGSVVHHRAREGEPESDARTTFPIPLDVADVAFTEDDVAWLAGPQGAVQIDGNRMITYREADGLRSEALRGVAWSAGTLYFAGPGGVATFDGQAWLYPRELALEVNDMEMGPDQRLWLATDRGLAVQDTSGVRRFDARRGLVENRIEDLTIDQYGRVWLRGPQSLGIVY